MNRYSNQCEKTTFSCVFVLFTLNMKLFYAAREMGNGLEQKNGANYMSPSFSLSSHELLWNNKHTKNQASILMPCSILSNHFVTWQVPLLVLANFSPQKMAWFQNWSRHRLGLVFCFQNCSDLIWEKVVLCSDQEKLLKFKAEGWEFAKFLRSLFRTIYSNGERSE